MSLRIHSLVPDPYADLAGVHWLHMSTVGAYQRFDVDHPRRGFCNPLVSRIHSGDKRTMLFSWLERFGCNHGVTSPEIFTKKVYVRIRRACLPNALHMHEGFSSIEICSVGKVEPLVSASGSNR